MSSGQKLEVPVLHIESMRAHGTMRVLKSLSDELGRGTAWVGIASGPGQANGTGHLCLPLDVL